ncbi:MAG: RimK family alpha-L-glutamate ligase [Planctomycetaceae bacterium]
MRIGLLGNAGSWYVSDLQRAGTERGHTVERLDYPTLTVSVGSERGITAEGRDLTDRQSLQNIDLLSFDSLVIRTMPPGSLEQIVFRMDTLSRLEALGVRVLNPPRTIEHAVDKFLTTSTLAAAGLPVPETLVCESTVEALVGLERLGGDVLVKPIFGAEGRGIVRVSDPDLGQRVFRTLERMQSVLYLQRFIQHPGYDIRILTLGGEVIGAIRRHANHSYKTNVACGGKAEAYDPTPEEVDLALKAASAVGVPFAGVDLLSGPDGKRYVIEVNGIPGWKGFSSATGIDVASHVVEWLER